MEDTPLPGIIVDYDEVLFCPTCKRSNLFPVKVAEGDHEPGDVIRVEPDEYVKCNVCGSIWQLKHIVKDLINHYKEKAKNG